MLLLSWEIASCCCLLPCVWIVDFSSLLIEFDAQGKSGLTLAEFAKAMII
jgi:hypothetical protein